MERDQSQDLQTPQNRLASAEVIITRERIISRLVDRLFTVTMVVSIAYFASDTIKTVATEWAGQVTVASLHMEASGNIDIPALDHISKTLESFCTYTGYGSLLLFAMGIGYGFRQRRLRRDKIEEMANYICRLEKALDSGRSSSNLTARGETNPEDKI